jgi:hypothetical protein
MFAISTAIGTAAIADAAAAAATTDLTKLGVISMPQYCARFDAASTHLWPGMPIFGALGL